MRQSSERLSQTGSGDTVTLFLSRHTIGVEDVDVSLHQLFLIPIVHYERRKSISVRVYNDNHFRRCLVVRCAVTFSRRKKNEDKKLYGHLYLTTTINTKGPDKGTLRKVSNLRVR